jgi:uncharacterized protein (DUF2141 family)
MKRLIFLILCLIGISNGTFSQLKLDIEISKIRSNNGNIMLQLFDKNEKVLMEKQSPIADSTCSFSFTDLGPGKYAVRFYHDENLNGKMETNLFGKPTEGYGFSNNVTGTFGPPPFKEWLFKINMDTTIVLIPTY